MRATRLEDIEESNKTTKASERQSGPAGGGNQAGGPSCDGSVPGKEEGESEIQAPGTNLQHLGIQLRPVILRIDQSKLG